MRLMDAALDLLAERGESAVTLRELTNAADANVAAVSYHFGSLKALCDAAVEHALWSATWTRNRRRSARWTPGRRSRRWRRPSPGR